MDETDLPADGQRRTILDARTSEHLAALDLASLRTYREELRAEEDKVSYWRRLLHARLDLVADLAEAGASRSVAAELDVDRLARVLGDTGTGASRAALHRVRAADPLPELPELQQVWRLPGPTHSADEITADLREAEERLTGYRRALHDRIDEATSELIARYREDPTQALALLT